MRKKQKQAFLFLLSAVTAAQLGLAYGAATPDALTKGTWAYENGSWKFYNENQMPLTGWVKSVSGWYYLNPADGEMVNSWQTINGIRYYFNTAADGLDGQMRTGWYQAPDKSWYFFNNVETDASVGSMLTGWQWIDGYCYYFNPVQGADYGKMLSNTTTADGYQLNVDGRWVGENGSLQYRQGAGFLTSKPVNAGYATGGGGGSSSGSGGNGGQTQTTYRYVLMNIPYADFYEAELSNNPVEVDAVSSATKNKTRTGSLVGGSYHKNADGTDISGVTFPVRVSSKIDLSAYDTVTDASKITITVTNRGQMTTTDYTGRDALFEADDYAYYALPAGEVPSYYKEMTIGADGKPDFSAVKGEAKEETALEPILKTETNYGDYQLDFKNLPESVTEDANTKAYGVVLHTREGEDYGLRHLENIWRKQELAWSAGFTLQTHGNPLSAAHYKTIMGKTINSITYYTNQGIMNFELTEDVYVPIKFTAGLSFGKDGAGTADADAGKDGISVQGLENMPEDFDALYTVTDTAGQALASFTADTDSVKWEGTPAAGQYELTVTDQSGKYAPVSGSFVLQTEEAAAKAEQKEDKSWTLAAADGVSDETFKAYLKSITSVTVDGTKYNASGRGSVSIINQETGEVKLDAKKDGQNLFEVGKTYQMSVQATGWKNDLTFEMKVEEAMEQPGETKIYKGESKVEQTYGMTVLGTYQAKVRIEVDANGKIVKIEDDGTAAGNNASFWEDAKNGKAGITGMFDQLSQKTKEEVEKLDTAPREDHVTPKDAVSGATISSNAIKEAVLDAFGNEPETPEQPEEGTNMTALKMTVDGKEYTYYYKKDTSTIFEPAKEPLMVGGVDVTDKAYQIRDNNDYSLKVYVYVPDGQKLPEKLYGTADVPYAEFYLAEKMTNDEFSKPDRPSLGQEHMGVTMLREGGYDAVSSATTGKYGRFTEASYGELRSEGEKAGYEINGVKTPVAIDGELYAEVKILAASGAKEGNSLADMVDSMTLSEKDAQGNAAERKLSTEEPAAYKKIFSDGTLSELTNSAGAQKLDAADIKASLTTESRYGNYQIDFENLPKEIQGSSNVLGVVIRTGNMPADVYGLEHLENIWLNASELAVAVKDGFVAHGNKISFDRYERLQGETIRSITFLLKGYQKVEIDGLELYCPVLLEDGQGVTAENADLVNGKDTEVKLTFNLPDAYKVKLASVTASGEEVPADAYTFDKESGVLSFKADSVKAGQYSLRIEDESGKYQPVSLSFILNSGLAAEDVKLEDNKLVISGDSGVTAEDYLSAVSAAYVDGSQIRARGVKLGELLFHADGSVNFDAEITGRDGSKTKIFKDGAEGSYTLKLEAPGYPSAEGKAGTESGTVTPPAENRELEGEAEVSGYHYTAKVKVVVDADGNIVSVSDNGTDAGSNETFWGMAQGMFAKFGGEIGAKTKAEVEALKTTPGSDDAAKVDAVSNATVSSNAIKEAVLDALSKNTEESAKFADGTWYGTGYWSLVYDTDGPSIVKVTIKDGKIENAEPVKTVVSRGGEEIYTHGSEVLNAAFVKENTDFHDILDKVEEWNDHEGNNGVKDEHSAGSAMRAKMSDSEYDAISGATNTALGELSAVQNALDRSAKFQEDGKEQTIDYMDFTDASTDNTENTRPLAAQTGDKLDLSNTELTVHFKDGTIKTVKPADFADYGIAADPADQTPFDELGLNVGDSKVITFKNEDSLISITSLITRSKTAEEKAYPTKIVLTLADGTTKEVKLDENDFHYSNIEVTDVVKSAAIYLGDEKLADGTAMSDTNWIFDLTKVTPPEGKIWRFGTYRVLTKLVEDTSEIASFTLDTAALQTAYHVGEALDLGKLTVNAVTEKGSHKSLSWDKAKAAGFTAEPKDGYVFTAEDLAAGTKSVTVKKGALKQSFELSIVEGEVVENQIPAKIEVYDGIELVGSAAIDEQAFVDGDGYLTLLGDKGLKLPAAYKGKVASLSVKAFNGDEKELNITVDRASDTMLRVLFPEYTAVGEDGGAVTMGVSFEEAAVTENQVPAKIEVYDETELVGSVAIDEQAFVDGDGYLTLTGDKGLKLPAAYKGKVASLSVKAFNSDEKELNTEIGKANDTLIRLLFPAYTAASEDGGGITIAVTFEETAAPEVEAPKLELGMFAKQVNEPKSYAGTVRLEASAADGLTIRYTTDGSEPTAESPETSGTITVKELTEEGKIAVKAAAFDQEGNKSKTTSLWLVYTRAGEDKNYISGDYEGDASGVTASVEISNLGAFGTPSIQSVKLDETSETAYADFLPELLSDVYLEQTADVATLSDYDEADQQKVLDAIKAALDQAVEEGGGAESGAVNIGGTAYGSIDEALEAAESGDVLEINEKIHFANNADGYANLPEKDLSIRSAEGEQFGVDAKDNAIIVQNGALNLDDVQWNANRHYANGYAFTAGQNVKMSVAASIGSGSRVIAGGAYEQGTTGDDAQLTFSSGKWDVVPGSDDSIKMSGNVTVLANGTSELWVSALPQDASLDGDINITIDGADGAKLRKLQVVSDGTKVNGNITVKLIGKVDLSSAYDSTLDITPDSDAKVGTLDLSEAEISAEDIKKFSGYENTILPEGQTAAAFAAEGVFAPVSFRLDASQLKDAYEVGEKIDLNDLVILAAYADGSTQALSWKEAKKAGFTASQNTVYTVKKADAENGEVSLMVSFETADGTDLEENLSFAVSEQEAAEEAETAETEGKEPKASADAEKAEGAESEAGKAAEKTKEAGTEVSADAEKAEEAETEVSKDAGEAETAGAEVREAAENAEQA